MGRNDEEVVPLIAPIYTLGQAALFEEIGRELRVATSEGQVGKMTVAMSLRGELREIRLHGEVTGKEVVEFGRRDASLDDVFIRFIHSAKLRIFLPFSVDRHFFNLHTERSDMAGAVDDQPQRIERPERHAQLCLREHVEGSRQRAEDKIGFATRNGSLRKANTNNLRAIEERGARGR